MDIFIEWMVKRKRNATDYLKIAGCVLGLFVLIYFVLGFMGTPLGGIVFIVAVALVYVLYRVVVSTNIEFEYCFTNGALDVDKIINVQRRKRLTELNARKIDIMASAKNPEYRRYIENSEIKKVYACVAPESDGLYFVIYSDDSGRKMLLFNPNDKIKDGFKKFNPQKVFLDD